MAYDKAAFGVEFRRRMEEYDKARGIQHAAAASRPPAEELSSRDTYGIEARARRQWEADPALRAEFGGRYESWLAYSKAEAKGLVRILGRGRGA